VRKKACKYRKKACILKSNFEIQRHFARGGSSDSSDEDMASCDGDIDCRSDEDEDDGSSPVYATRSSAHGVKQQTLTGNDIAVIYLILRPRLTSLSELLH